MKQNQQSLSSFELLQSKTSNFAASNKNEIQKLFLKFFFLQFLSETWRERKLLLKYFMPSEDEFSYANMQSLKMHEIEKGNLNFNYKIMHRNIHNWIIITRESSVIWFNGGWEVSDTIWWFTGAGRQKSHEIWNFSNAT